MNDSTFVAFVGRLDAEDINDDDDDVIDINSTVDDLIVAVFVV